ncbi:hypothetical protein F5X98DRAFT_391544 [Xylaria grammica]|nr:hypothetical protein F5X98DRAFT_391544 [Xylaria grammica]
MVEIFRLRIDNIGGQNPGSLYGTIIATDGLGNQYIYNRDRSEPESVSPGKYALLTGPPQTIEAADSFAFIVDLKDYDYVSFDNNIIAQGTINWDAYNIANEYDKAITETIKGASGAVTLHYIVLSDTAQALVEVILIKGDGEDPVNVYGHITAYNEHGDSDIFQKPDSDSYIDVSPNTYSSVEISDCCADDWCAHYQHTSL